MSVESSEKSKECKGCAPEKHMQKDYWIVWEDECVFINLCFGYPYALGHVVIQPRKRKIPEEDEYHAKDISNLTGDEWKAISKWVPKVSKAMKKVLKEFLGKEIERIYLCSFNETKNWHVHFHLIPRYECETLMGDNLLFYRAKAKLMISSNDRDRIVQAMRRELGVEKKFGAPAGI